jgi:hypothetical protein
MLSHGNSAKCKMQCAKCKAGFIIRLVAYQLLLIFCLLFFAACRSTPTDMRSLAPAESLIYLETGDLGVALESLTENENFSQNAKIKPDFSMLENAQTAIIVTGFESSAKQLTDNAAILDFKPQFVLIADTHSWERTNFALVENQIGHFVSKVYGDSVKLEKSERSGVKFFIWTVEDNRKIYSAVDGNLIYIGNNEATIDKCLAVKRGEAENLLKNESLAQAREKGGDKKLAFGYISTEGIKQIADFVGVSVAVDAAEEDLTKSFIAKIMPPLLQKTVREISWTAKKTDQGIEDRIYIKPDAAISEVWKETLILNTDNQLKFAEYIPVRVESLTIYRLQNPQIAWRSVLLALADKLENFDGKVWLAASGSFFAPFGVADAETFLSAINPNIVTVRLNSENSEPLAIAEVKDEAKLKSSLFKEFNFNSAPEKIGAASIWKAVDSEQSAAFIDGKVILGNRNDILTCLKVKENGANLTGNQHLLSLLQTNALTVTNARDTETTSKIINVLGNGNKNAGSPSFYMTETRFNSNGIERRTVSDFGLFGTLISQFDEVK